MQSNISDKPYVFVPPIKNGFWPSFFQLFLKGILRRTFGVQKVEIRNGERLRASIDAGHGILLAQNHARPADPFVMGMLSRAVKRHFFQVASRHVFEEGRIQRFCLRRCGGFSVWREGVDRQSLRTAVEILTEADRPLVVAPEGILTRCNDKLFKLMDGVAFMARTAAKHRADAKAAAGVVLHATVIKYFFHGDIRAALEPTLTDLETRLSWRPVAGMPLVRRIQRMGEGLLALKEVEYYGQARTGHVRERVPALINHLLAPLEKEWLNGRAEADTTERVKKLRIAIVPTLVAGGFDEAERARRWRQLADIYLAQCLALYPPDYIKSRPTAERLMETVERFEEDVTDHARIYPPMRAVVQVGEAIPVSPARERGPGGDPLMKTLTESMQGILNGLIEESRPLDDVF